MKMSIGDFLLRRLQKAGIHHIFGVPGDYNLELMQQLKERGEPAGLGIATSSTPNLMRLQREKFCEDEPEIR